MAEANDVLGSIYQNLIDGGCDAQTVEYCISFVKEKRYAELIPFLSQHKETLLKSVHLGQKQIDCIDYLIYKLKKL